MSHDTTLSKKYVLNIYAYNYTRISLAIKIEY